MQGLNQSIPTNNQTNITNTQNAMSEYASVRADALRKIAKLTQEPIIGIKNLSLRTIQAYIMGSNVSFYRKLAADSILKFIAAQDGIEIILREQIQNPTLASLYLVRFNKAIQRELSRLSFIIPQLTNN